MKLGYLGPKGSYSYEAALFYSKDSVLYEMDNFHDIIDGVEEGSLDEGILPLENSTEGVVTQVADALLHTQNAFVNRELVMPIVHNLYSHSGKMEGVKYILSHLQVLEQCRHFLRTYYPGIKLIPCGSSSQACIRMKAEGPGYAAVAGSSIGVLYGLKLVREAIQDNSWNETRFVVIGRKKTEKTGDDKTSIAFTFSEDQPGTLYSVMKEFADARINLSRIESRPAKSQIGKYVFYIDFAGHQAEEPVKALLDRIGEKTNHLKVLGSYPIFK